MCMFNLLKTSLFYPINIITLLYIFIIKKTKKKKKKKNSTRKPNKKNKFIIKFLIKYKKQEKK